MPYFLKKVKGNKYYVVDISGNKYSKKPLPKARAERQLKALHINTGHGFYGGMYGNIAPGPSTSLPNLSATAPIVNPLRQASVQYNADGVPHSERYLRFNNPMRQALSEYSLEDDSYSSGNLSSYSQPAPPPLQTRPQAPAQAPAPAPIANPMRTQRPVMDFNLGQTVGTPLVNSCMFLGNCLAGQGRYSEPDTHILIGDYLEGGGSGKWTALINALARMYNIPKALVDSTIALNDRKTGARRFNEKKQNILSQFSDYLNPTIVNEILELDESDPKSISDYANAIDARRDIALSLRTVQTTNPLQVSVSTLNPFSGRSKFIKKYLKGQGLPATKKNVEKICNIMDVEGIVFE